MVLALQILLWVIAILLLIAVLVLITPLQIVLSSRNEPGAQTSVDVHPLGGTVGRYRVFDSLRKRRAKKDVARTKDKHTTKRRVPPNWLHKIPGVVARVVRAIHVETLVIDGEFGLGDPAETGRLFGQLTPLIYCSGGKVNLRPNFQSACWRGSIEAHLRVIPIAFLWPIIGLFVRVYRPNK